ncbi:hypothetical protein BS78_01G024200 [Paspalum vaginatum]|nr:hypothetical protein BS78_01G024200 [Paspalum vaginatum]
MANLTNLAALLFAVVTATVLPVRSARTLERVYQVAIPEVSSVAKPPSSTVLEVAALIPFDGQFEEVVDGLIAGGSPAFIPLNGQFEEAAAGPLAAGYRKTDCARKTPAFGP